MTGVGAGVGVDAMTSNIYKTLQEKTRVLRDFFQADAEDAPTFIVIRDEENEADLELVKTEAGQAARVTGKMIVVRDRVLYLLTLSRADVALALSLQASIGPGAGARVVRFQTGSEVSGRLVETKFADMNSEL